MGEEIVVLEYFGTLTAVNSFITLVLVTQMQQVSIFEWAYVFLLSVVADAS